ncbi:endonuclease domain-containing protein [Parafrigoribacterium soli]|uniref:endonuclease domain-containing protein n=1 Tax=Parafrigoribacterium soli TaxID=3144663 RepID=UPI0032F09B91
MDVNRAFPMGTRITTRRQLLRRGMTPADLTVAVRSGQLLRARRDRYALPDTERAILEAVRIGGLVTCISAADLYGIWVPDQPFTHVAMAREASRMRSPHDRFVRLTVDNRDGCELHWSPLIEPATARLHSVGRADSLAHIIRCQPRVVAVAALDSALHERVISPADLDRIFAAVPAKYAALRDEIDSRCMSGIETIVRLLCLDAGVRCVPQVHFPGIGTVDFVLEGCVVVETDGHKGHASDSDQKRDYDRDAALAARGYIVLRFNYRQVMFQSEVVMAAIRGALRSHRAAH